MEYINIDQSDLRMYRAKARKSVEQMALLTQISISTIRSIERGDSVTVSRLRKYMQYLGQLNKEKYSITIS